MQSGDDDDDHLDGDDDVLDGNDLQGNDDPSEIMSLTGDFRFGPKETRKFIIYKFLFKIIHFHF